uniref:Prefoldin subunit 5-like n=1 Tax=Geotrypetes seraphini TaxID=260995 RepID=A0A6P8P3Y4_GEOSA|nr:prefoldin subunit 5-like [Geotrypetes seraphini]
MTLLEVWNYVEHVLIDVGTGYYVEKAASDARDFFKRKIDFLTKQIEKIQPALQEKHAMKQAVMEMMSLKIQQLTASQAVVPVYWIPSICLPRPAFYIKTLF